MTATARSSTAARSTPSSTIEVRDAIREAISERRTVRIVGSGSWLDANRPVHAQSMLVMQELHGIVDYEPGDLTLTARAGTTLDEITRATAANGQWLTLDPPGNPARATLGATIATASYGPLAHHFGTPRDMTLGVEMVTGIGDIVRGGGRVVKNVAGFDLTRLATGSWGSLGVITEITVRLRALPTAQVTLAIDVPSTMQEVDRWRAELRRLPFMPLAATLTDRRLANKIDVSRDGAVLLVRLGGNEEAVRAQRDQLRALGNSREESAGVWDKLRTIEPPSAAVVRLSSLPSLVGRTWDVASRIASGWADGYCHADLGRGVVRLVLPLGAGTESEFASALDVAFEGSRIYERLPASLWPRLASPANSSRIGRGVRSAFDPHNILNPGIFGESE